MELDPRRLRFLLAVARTGGVLAAADELSVTPSAVSQQLARLEREVGRDLLVRTTTGSVLTPAGLTLAETAADVERAVNLGRSRLERDAADLDGAVRLGCFESFVSTVIAPSLAGWRERHAGLRFEVFEYDQDDMLKALRAGSLDVVVVELDTEETAQRLPSGVSEIPLLDEPWKLLVPTGTLLTQGHVDLQRISLPWLGVDPDAASARAVRRIRRSLGGPSEELHVFYGTRSALALVAAGEGIALMPSLALQGVDHPGVEALDVPGLGTRRIALRRYGKSGASAETMDAAIMLIREAVAELQRQAEHSSA